MAPPFRTASPMSLQSDWDRFWASVDKTGTCWIWTAALKTTGYGLFWTGSKLMAAHRVIGIYQLGFKTDSDVCHTCDNRRCVRPDHLFEGSRKDNMQDAVRKNRHRSSRKVTFDIAEKIRAEYRPGHRWDPNRMSQAMLARKYGLHQASVQGILSRRFYDRKW